jgi:NADH:ubiquinone oxidoreductase subunit 2 (subunit N)
VLHAATVLPALVVAIGGVAIVLLGRTGLGRFSALLCWIALTASAVTLAVARPEPLPEPPARPSVSAVTLDPLARGTAWMALFLGVMGAVVTGVGSSTRAASRYAFLLLSLAGVLLACVANDFVLIVVGVPVSVLAICVGQFRESTTDDERIAAVQSLVLSALSAVCLVSGALLVTALAGTTNFAELHSLPAHGVSTPGGGPGEHLAGHSPRTLPLAGEIGVVLLLAGFGIPLLAAPFQLAAAEILEGASAWSLALSCILPRCAVLVAMIRVFVEGPPRYVSTAQTALTAVALVTLLIGGSLAYWQSSLRRLVALVVMVQAGLILLALAAGCSEAARPDAVRWLDLDIPGGAGAAWLLFVVDSLALCGLAAILSGLERSDNARVDDLESFTQLARGSRATATAAALLLFDLGGIPPLPGFWTRVAVLRSVLSVSFAPENDFLPHQNTGYVLFALLTIGALIAVAAPCLFVAARLLVGEQATERAKAPQVSPTAVGSRSSVRFGAAIALLLLGLGIVPGAGLRIAARVTFNKQAASALAAEKPAQPVKKHRRGSLPNAEPSD